MKDVYGLFIMSRSCLSKNYQKLISVPIHINNLQVVATEVFKVYRNIYPPIVRQLFQLRNNDYNLGQFSQFHLPNVRSVFCLTESISFLYPKIWNIVPNEFKK